MNIITVYHLFFQICSSLNKTPKIRVAQDAPKHIQNNPVNWIDGAANLYNKYAIILDIPIIKNKPP